jgi:acyl carrier protein
VSPKELKATLEDRLRFIIIDLLAVDEASIRAETRLREDLEADELDLVELLMAVEDEWGLEIPDSDVVEGASDTKGGKWRVRSTSVAEFLGGNWKLKTVGDWVTYLTHRLGD